MSATFLLLFLGGSIFFSRAEGRMMELQQQSKLKDTSSGISQKTNEDSEHEVFLRQLHNQSGIAGFLLEHEPGSILDDNWDASTVEEGECCFMLNT
ncbi:unnamed protein product [Schistocephalus solidus]|uniref:Secreted protein n=1 Tax=Schistocephalus solidus TaxID=70667 RepID=A0A183TF87_SCHSO|nr:unnamed protein product [Schistocephalus solidus]